jgi:hypothetical protein
MEFLHRVDRVAEMFEGVVRPEDADFAVTLGQRSLRSAAI